MVLISSMQSLMTFARKPTFSTVPLAPDLLLDGQNFFNLFNTGSCKVFGILLQVNTSLTLLQPKRGPDPSHLFCSRIIASRFLTHQWTKTLRVYQTRPQSFFKRTPTRLSYLSKDKVLHPITRQGEEVRLAPRLSFKDTLGRGTDATQPILQEVLTFYRSKAESVTIWCFL